MDWESLGEAAPLSRKLGMWSESEAVEVRCCEWEWEEVGVSYERDQGVQSALGLQRGERQVDFVGAC